jgi:SAM-dependent methyltransferase
MIATTALPRLEKVLPLLVCPTCRVGLRRDRHALSCDGCGVSFGFREGRPIFLPDPSAVRIMPAEHISNPVPTAVLDWMTWLDGLVLNLGAGGSRVKLDNCIEVEYAIFRHTDVVADAHYLPFADETFDAVVTFNTFEHLCDPARAATELYRVLKPGGKLVLQTAFLQPVHEAPYHFYNTTEYGLRRWLQAFSITKLEVSENFNPAHVIAWVATEILQAIEATQGSDAARQLASAPLSFWRSTWENPTERQHPFWKMVGKLPQEIQKKLSAGFHVEAIKPDPDDERLC